MTTLWVGLGGALGTIARYHLGLAVARRWSGFPWGTLVINVLGSLLLGVVMQLALRGRLDEPVRVALGVGVLGGFTTYSTFNFETFAMVQAGHHARAAAYVVATLAGALLAGLAGWALAGALTSRT